MPSQKLLFRKSSPLSGEGWALLVVDFNFSFAILQANKLFDVKMLAILV